MDKPDDVINAMCLTWRHDFGLNYQDVFLGQVGMTEQERDGLRLQMRQIYEHHFLPAILKAKNDAYEEAALISDKYADYEHNWNSDTSEEIRNLKHEGER